jgi:hypothetical protein
MGCARLPAGGLDRAWDAFADPAAATPPRRQAAHDGSLTAPEKRSPAGGLDRAWDAHACPPAACIVHGMRTPARRRPASCMGCARLPAGGLDRAWDAFAPGCSNPDGRLLTTAASPRPRSARPPAAWTAHGMRSPARRRPASCPRSARRSGGSAWDAPARPAAACIVPAMCSPTRRGPTAPGMRSPAGRQPVPPSRSARPRP